VGVDRTLVLGVDLDAVCADYEGAFRMSVARQLSREPAELPPQTLMDGYSQWGLSFEQFEEAHRRAVLEDRIFRQMSPMPGVSEALWQLSDEGVWIRIITHRLIFNGAHEVSAADTAWWLEHHRIPYRDLCFIGAKPDVGAEVYVDDSPTNIVALRGAGRTALVFDQPYNALLAGPRVHDWGEVVAYVLGVLEGRRAQIPLPFEDDTARAAGEEPRP
jgi:5'(3')-deoxyribonucleotidase